jgi:FAD:protein FMN transferase
MKKQAVIMGMPVKIEVIEKSVTEEDINEIFSYLHYIDKKFSIFKTDSEISQINSGELTIQNASKLMQQILKLCEETKRETNGYFDININGKLDPSGIVKGYAISQGARLLKKKGFKNFSVEIAGDIQISGKNSLGQSWRIGIQNPFNLKEIIKVVYLSNKGIATSGNYQRGEHIYDPVSRKKANEIASVTVITDDVYDADRFATAAFAMGEGGISFLEKIKGIEGYMVTKSKSAILTNGFEKYLYENN